MASSPSTMARAERLVRALYQQVGSNQETEVSVWDLGDKLGWSRDITDAVTDYAIKRHWAPRYSMGGAISITIDGIDLAENFPQMPRTGPPSPTSQPLFSPVTFNINAPVTQPVFQVAGAHSTQSMEVASTEAIAVVKEVVDRLATALAGRNDNSSELEQLKADLETAKAQLAAPAPRKAVLVQTLRSIAEGALGSALGAFMTSAMPQLPGLLQRAFNLLG